MSHIKRITRVLIGLLVAVPLASCWVPDKYGSEIRITKAGGYGISFSGELTWAPLFGQIARGEIATEAAAEQSAGFLATLKADTHFQHVASLSKGRYQVRYDRRGTIDRTQMISFVRRNARIFQIRAQEDGKVSFFGTGAGSSQADQLDAMGLKTDGLLRIVTDAPVLSHNAMSVRPAPMPGYVMYDWKMTSFRQKAPKLTLQLDGPLATTGPGA